MSKPIELMQQTANSMLDTVDSLINSGLDYVVDNIPLVGSHFKKAASPEAGTPAPAPAAPSPA